MTEIWKSVVGYEGRYEVSDLGRVRSLRFRSVLGTQLMTPVRNYSGYYVVSLGANPKRQFRLHCLVLEAFVGLRPKGMQGCHNDSDKSNNQLFNLRWDTPKGNVADRPKMFGENNPRSKLTDEQRMEIVRRRRTGETTVYLGREFGISSTRVSQLVKESMA
jgi:hypothetical protein